MTLSEFRAAQGFALDDYQVTACAALEAGNGVLVAAPTGAGKTVVGEFAVHLALRTGGKAFYTTPIKALSNQKYADLVAAYGADRVGLLTGDTSLNPGAPVVVMTTEVLRNMLYAGSDLLDGLRFVVMDEVHYLADRFRGPVWEEVIIHLPSEVRVVSLSATVSNAEEFGDWLQMVRGDTTVVVSERRPVPLWQHVMVSSSSPHGPPEILDLGAGPSIPADVRSAFRGPLIAKARSAQAGRRGGPQRGGGSAARRRYPPRPLAVQSLQQAGLLPAICFIFSRNGCEQAVSQCLRAGLTLTTNAESAEIEAFSQQRVADIPREDLETLGFFTWQQALMRGVAAHHAGLLPVFKETVEHLFSRGLLKVVFATETLALGINMPARSVMLEKLSKFDGVAVNPLTPGEYTQLTGRAGRRGIDVEGHAVVVDHPGLDPLALASLASKRLYPLRSSFRPTYNMAVNLIASVGAVQAREVLETSFAQFQADRAVVHLAQQARDVGERLAAYPAGQRPRRLEREYHRLVARVEGQTGSVARTFDKTCRVLRDLGYLQGGRDNYRNTDDGLWLRRIYVENDLLLAEALRAGVWDHLPPAELAAAVSAVIYQGRREGASPPLPGGPQGRLGLALQATGEVWARVTDLEERHGLEATGALDLGFTEAIWRWASGRPLAGALRGGDLTAGDFVRWAKQVIDVLEQASRAAPSARLAQTALQAQRALLRGVVAYSSL